jgi:dCTP deaminase
MTHKDPEKNREYKREWAQRQRDHQRTDGTRRDYMLRIRYGISEAEWDQMFDRQGQRCAICKCQEPKSKVGWHTDHDHDSGEIRGILCENCNRGLGMYEHDISFLRRAAAYLGIHQGVLGGNAIGLAKILSPFSDRQVQNGMSFGKSYAGYDIRVDQAMKLEGKEFKLASSIEYFDMPSDVMAIVHDKSTWARRGLQVFNTVIEPGWRGYLTLELVNHSIESLSFEHGDPIAQIIFHSLDQPAENSYTGKYQDQERGAQAARDEGTA